MSFVKKAIIVFILTLLFFVTLIKICEPFIKEQISTIFEGKWFAVKIEKELDGMTKEFTPEKKEFYKTFIKKMYTKWKPLIEEAIKEAEKESKKQ
jgi:hypothetical protein